nr:P-loop NTPase fold protein [uncultured Flavobacterium sp.]
MTQKYKYKILREEVEAEDFYQDQTHEKIKCSLIELIKSEDNGITIGLSGQWGSGKSTIINLLKNDKENIDTFSFFYFDAWAHEGDPLRRIFLESLINSFKSENDPSITDQLEEIRKIISREKKTKTIKVKRSTTTLGLLLTIATFIFTIGVAVLSSINYDNLTLESKYPINWAFSTGATLATLPFIILFGNWIQLLWKKKKVSDLNNWSFLQNNSDETITEDVIGEDERSSIEFEKYFKEILELYNTKKGKKIVIVLDNLDRVDAEVSLKIWSTLQTFIQHKNPNSKDYKTFKNIFTIIPYDEESLMKIWKNYTENEQGVSVFDNKFASSFFDKSFQVRIDVPKPIISNWLDFIEKMIEKSFPSWDKSDKEAIIEVIEKTRKDILDSPNPREIKTYLNQIGFLRNLYKEEISTKSIAFYTYKRYLKGFSNDKIGDYLLNRFQVSKEEINLIDEETILEIASIIYGVDKNQGAQILLTPKIIEALNKNKPELLKELILNYSTVFWSIFKNRVSITDKLRDYLRYSSPINQCFENYDKDINNNFLPLLSRYLNKERDYNYSFDEEFAKDIKNASELFFKFSNGREIEQTWSFFSKVYEYQENLNRDIGTIDDERNLIFVDTLHHIFHVTKIDFEVKVLNIKFENWRELNRHNDFSKISMFYCPSQKNITETVNYINPGSNIPDIVYSLVNNYIQHNSLNLEPILLNLENHLSWNDGTQNGTIFSSKSIELFENFFYNYKNYDYNIFLKSPHIYTVCHFTKMENEKLVNLMSTICAIHFKQGITDFENEISTNNQYSNAFITLIKNHWLTSDPDNALYTYEKFKKYNLLKNIWEISSNNAYILCCDIIDLMVSNNDNEEFILDNPFDTLIEINKFEKEGFDISKVVQKLFEYSRLEEDIIATEDLELISNNYLVYEILNLNTSEKIFKKIESELMKLDTENLRNSISENDYLFDILLIVKEKKPKFSLDNLNDVLYEFVYGSFLINNPVFTIQKWQSENWSKIINLLDETHFENFCKRVTKLLVAEKENLKIDFFELNTEFIDKQFLVELINKEKDSFSLYIQEALQSPAEIAKLKFIEKLIEIENGKKFKFAKTFKELIKENVLNLNEEGNSEELKRVSRTIAKRFSIN